MAVKKKKLIKKPSFKATGKKERDKKRDELPFNKRRKRKHA